jgi:hypothetical protein
MTNPIIREHNLDTNEVIDREMTDSEYAEFLKSFEPTPEEIAKHQAKENAKAKLEALGLTLDDLAALGL